MRLYDSTLNKIVDVNTINHNGLRYVSKMTNAELIECGYYRVAYEAKPDDRYYDAIDKTEILGDFYTTSYEAVEKELDSVKVRMKADVKAEFMKRSISPIVDTGLGFSVDGGRNNLQDFESGLALMVLTVRASDDTMHLVTEEEMKNIITRIRANGLMLYQTKWTKEVQIDALENIDACKLYEATPYDIEVDKLDENMLPTGEKIISVAYKNNITEW